MDKLKELLKELKINVSDDYFSDDITITDKLDPKKDAEGIIAAFSDPIKTELEKTLKETLSKEISDQEKVKSLIKYKKIVADKLGLKMTDNERKEKDLEKIWEMGLEAITKEQKNVLPEDYQKLQGDLVEAKNLYDALKGKYDEETSGFDTKLAEALAGQKSSLQNNWDLQSILGKIGKGKKSDVLLRVVLPEIEKIGVIGKDASGKLAVLDKEDPKKLAMIDGKPINIEEFSTSYLQEAGILAKNDFDETPDPIDLGGGSQDFNLPSEKAAM